MVIGENIAAALPGLRGLPWGAPGGANRPGAGPGGKPPGFLRVGHEPE